MSVAVGGAGVGEGSTTVAETVGAEVNVGEIGVGVDVGGATVGRRVGVSVCTIAGLAACVAARVEVGVRVCGAVDDEVRAGEAVGPGSPPQSAIVSKHRVVTTTMRGL